MSWRQVTSILLALAGLFVLSMGGSASAQNPPPEVTTRALRIGEVGVPYSALMSAEGGAQPRRWTIARGALPPGLTLLESIGVIAGIPTTPGVYGFAVGVTDGAGMTDLRALTLPIGMPVSIDASVLPNAQQNHAYSHALTVFGGVAPYAWSIPQGALPVGLALDEERGVISGTPSEAGTSSFVVHLRDGLGGATTRPLSIAVRSLAIIEPDPSPTLGVTTIDLPQATAGIAYAHRLQASGGVPPLTWHVVAGKLPSGLRLNSTSGVLAGTPTANDEALFVVLVRDASGAHTGRTLRLVPTPTAKTDLTAWVRAVCAAGFGDRPSVTRLCDLYASGQLAGPWHGTLGRAILALARDGS